MLFTTSRDPAQGGEAHDADLLMTDLLIYIFTLCGGYVPPQDEAS